MELADHRCVHCAVAHDPALTVCPATGLSLHGPQVQSGIARAARAFCGEDRSRFDLGGRLLGGMYRIAEIIGEGGMGAVYAATDVRGGREVAIKVLHPQHACADEAVARLEREARAAGTIGHPNICQVWDTGWIDEGSPYLVMERLRGVTLAERLLRERVIPENELTGIAVQVLGALGAAHAAGITHRDLKPENIFILDCPSVVSVKLLDFGISKAADGESSMDLTRTGMVMGTPYYMAPEQARGDRQLDPRVDLWALGVILYEALTARRPFVGRNYNALLMQILTSRHKPIEEVSPSVPLNLARVVDKALAKMREDRYQSAVEFAAALGAVAKADTHADIEDSETVVYEGASPGAPTGTGALPPDLDDDRTIVDPPSFSGETVTTVRSNVPPEQGT